jgi:plasmid stabilization system protein ParE
LIFRFKVASHAAQQIRTAAEWWLKSRSKSPNAFAEDLEAAFTLIQELPNAGEAVQHPTILNVRRILLGRVHYHLYYSVSTKESVVEVLALWHTSRGSAPPF